MNKLPDKLNGHGYSLIINAKHFLFPFEIEDSYFKEILRPQVLDFLHNDKTEILYSGVLPDFEDYEDDNVMFGGTVIRIILAEFDLNINEDIKAEEIKNIIAKYIELNDDFYINIYRYEGKLKKEITLEIIY